MTNQALEFDDVSADASWAYLDEGDLKKQISGLSSRVTQTAAHLEKVIFNNDYEDTEKMYNDLALRDLSLEGWANSFISFNTEAFDKYLNGTSKPEFYAGLSMQDQKAYDICLKYYKDLKQIAPILHQLCLTMTLLPLKDGFKFQRLVLNLIDEGYDEEFYDQINRDVEDICTLINTSWEGMERGYASSAEQYYNQNAGGVSRSELIQGYRSRRLRSYQIAVESFKYRDFRANSDGTFSLDLNMYILLEILDKYTMQLSILPNIKDPCKKVMEECHNNMAALNKVFADIRTENCQTLLNAVDDLMHKIYSYAETSLAVYEQLEKRDGDAPYRFLKKLPAYSRMSGKYYFTPITADPFHDGTQYVKLFKSAVRTLNEHCKEFVYDHGHPELK
ncbi:MAG: hypothetical protein IKE21_07230 [Erysipelotrichaceae bacterium]|nr:hypothetical protein [Erysipelotrichaceae bacterium]